MSLTKGARTGWDDMMRAALAGDEAAYRRLLAELAQALRATVRRTLAHARRSEGDAEDVVQEILLAVHLKRHTWDPRQPLAPWAFAVARHKTIDALRRAGRATHVSIDDFVENIAAPPEGAGDRSDVERLIGRLDARQSRIVRGVSLDGRSTKEMADDLNMSEGAVRVDLHRALKRLAALYRSDGE